MKISSPSASFKRRTALAGVVSSRQDGTRWPRVAFFLSLILQVQIALLYLVTWIDSPRRPTLVPLVVNEYQARPLASLIRPISEPAVFRDGTLFTETLQGGSTRQALLQTLDNLAKRTSSEAVVVYLSALALEAEGGDVYLLPSDAVPGDPWTWLRLKDVLQKLKACPARQKLLVFDFMPPIRSGRLASVHSDIPDALLRQLAAVPDVDRCVLCSCSAGQSAQLSYEPGQTIFAYYFQQALRGHADGWDDAQDGRVTVRELAAYVKNRVERWSLRNRAAEQTPVFFGNGSDFPVAVVDAGASSAPPALPPARSYPAFLLDAWKARDAAYLAGQNRLAPRLFRKQQALLHAAEQAWGMGMPEAAVRKLWLEEAERSQESLLRMTQDFARDTSATKRPSDTARETFAESWRYFQRQLTSAKPDDVERVKLRFMDEVRGKVAVDELDAVVFAHALSEDRLDPGTLRLYDRLLHPTPQTVPRSRETLRLRQLADLAMRVEVFAWPRDLVASLLRATDLTEKGLDRKAHLPGFTSLLEEPMQNRHEGEVRMWARGFANLEEAKQRLTTACAQMERLGRLNDQWGRDQEMLDEALAELPLFGDLLEKIPSLRGPWSQAAVAAQLLKEKLQPAPLEKTLSWDDQVDKIDSRVRGAETHAVALRQSMQDLRAPFVKEEIARLERRCRQSGGDAGVLASVEALLSFPGPELPAEGRAALWQAADILGRRLHQESLAADGDEHPSSRPMSMVGTRLVPFEEESRRAIRRANTEITLLGLAGVAEDQLRPIRAALERCKKDTRNHSSWPEVGMLMHRLATDHVVNQYRREKSWGRRESLGLVLSPLDRFAGIDDVLQSPTLQHCREAIEARDRWSRENDRYLARDYQGINLESQGILAARAFYAKASEASVGKAEDEAHVKLNVAGVVEPLTAQHPYAHFWLDVTRVVPPGAFGPVQLQAHRPDEVWLEIAPESAALPALRLANQPRTLANKVPLKVTRSATAERTGLPAPVGFLLEARFEKRAYHHLVMTPIPLNPREVQILVSKDPNEPGTTVQEIGVRPGKMKQPFYLYVKNLTNRPRKIHVDVRAGETTLLKSPQPLTLEADSVRKIPFADASTAKLVDLRGALQIQVLDQERQKVLETRMLPIAILAPHEYVRVAEVAFEPGGANNNKFVAQVEASKYMAGPAIAAELVLPARRIPGLLGVGGGTLQVDLPTQARNPRLLFAERIRLANDAEEEGPVYLNIDGVPRAFVYKTTFTPAGDVTRPQRDERPAVRLGAPTCVMAGVNYLVDIEVDNAPRGARLEVALGRVFNGEGFSAEVVREFVDAKKQRIGLEAEKEALVFDATVQDWTTTFDTRSIVGTRELRARLLDDSGKEIARANQTVVIDNSPPVVRMMPAPHQLKRGTSIALQAHGSDPESGIGQVFFFLGRPEKGEAPPSALKLKAAAANLHFTLWATVLNVPPDHQGPLAVSVCAVNNAGMASVDTATFEVIDRDPGKTGLGQITGRVVEGARPQPNLTVVLTDERGTEITRTRTQADGGFTFLQLPPGQFRLQCVKPESQRRAVQGVRVEPDRISRAELSLAL